MDPSLKRPNPFRWPTAQQPNDIIEISSDEEDVEPPMKIPKMNFPVNAVQDAETRAQAEALSNAFRDCIASIVPINFVDEKVRRNIQQYSDWLLDMAATSGASIFDVSIDENCLPTWPGLVWDPEAESLHQVMQRRLMEHQRAEEISVRVRCVIVKLANARLLEAQMLGVPIRDVAIGADLLPTWRGRDPDADEGEDADSESSGDDYTDMDYQDSVQSCDELPWSSDNSSRASEDGVAEQAHQLSSAWSSDSESDLSLSEYDDEVSLRNFVYRVPSVEESDDDEDTQPGNIIFDVDLLGSSVDNKSVDFAVYLAEVDSDIEKLPEVELAIDEEGFSYHHHLVDAVDIELAEGGVYCAVSQDETKPESCTETFPGSTDASTVNDLTDEPTTPASVKGDTEAVADAASTQASGEAIPEDWILI